MSAGPLAQGEDRLPRTEWPPPDLDDAPSDCRPLALRLGHRADPRRPVARHRTEAHQKPHEAKTSRDSIEEDDTWHTPDD